MHGLSCLRWQVSIFLWWKNSEKSISNEEESLMKQSYDSIHKGDGCLGSFSHLMINKIGLAFSSETKT